MSAILLWSLYFVGVVLSPIVVGMTFGIPSKGWGKIDHYMAIFLLSLIWPLVLVFAVACAALYLPALLSKALVHLGVLIRCILSRPKKRDCGGHVICD